MAILTFPTLSRLPSRFEFGIKSNTSVFESQLSSTIQTVETPSPKWTFSFSMENLLEDDIVKIQSFLAQLRGMAGRFYMYNMARPSPRGIATGTPVVSGASQTGTSINTSGWTPSQTGIYKQGDFFSIGGELKICTSDVNSDGSGLATIPFEFPIRTSPADASSVVITQPTAVFRLTSDTSNWTTTAPLFHAYTLSGEEVI